MPLLMLLFVAVLVALAAGSAGYVLGRSSVPPPADSNALAERDGFIEELRELAWQHRDVSPELSTIIIDEITTRHRRLSGPND